MTPITADELANETSVDRAVRLADPTPVEEGCWPTPNQLLHRWENSTDEERLAMCARALDDAQRASDCFVRDHERAEHFARMHVCVGLGQSAGIETEEGT